MIPQTALVLLWLLPGSIPATNTPEHPFFGNIQPAYPGFAQLSFQLSAGNTASAFLTISHWLNQTIQFSDFYQHLPENQRRICNDLIEQKPEQFDFQPLLQERPTDLELFIALGQVMTCRYRASSLSGIWAEKAWVLLLARIQAAYQSRKPGYEQAALLQLAQKLSFFRNAPKWAKRSQRSCRKLKKSGAGPQTALVEAVLAAAQ